MPSLMENLVMHVLVNPSNGFYLEQIVSILIALILSGFMV